MDRFEHQQNGKVYFESDSSREIYLRDHDRFLGAQCRKNLLVRVGNIEKSVTLSADGATKPYKIDFNGVKSANTIELIAPEPISPAEFTHGKSTDTRIIALALVSIKILTAP